jgi:hypothetical protein
MSSAYEGLPVYKASTDMVSYFETIVRGFPRYHKYTIGTELRNLSYAILDLIVEANRKIDRVEKLKIILNKLQKLKSRLQVCFEIKAFRNPNSFPTATRKVIDIAKQCEGWLWKCQNPGREVPLRENANTKSLGTHTTEKLGIRTQGVVPQGSAPDGPKRR